MRRQSILESLEKKDRKGDVLSDMIAMNKKTGNSGITFTLRGTAGVHWSPPWTEFERILSCPPKRVRQAELVRQIHV